MKNFCLSLIIFLSLNGLLSAAPLYILYDESCMDRLEYIQENTDNDEPYVVYQVNTGANEKIVFEVGTESSNPQDYKPSLVYNCDNAVFDQKLVKAINDNIDQAFMVVKKGRRYFVSPINFAALYIHTEDVIFYDSPKYRFQFDRKNGAVGENIAKSPKAQVTFEGAMDRLCTSTYIFRQYDEFAGNPYTDVLIVPEIGVVEERSGINLDDALSKPLKLTEVNGKGLDRYIRQMCKDEEDTRTGSTIEDFTADTQPESYYTPERTRLDEQQPPRYRDDSVRRPATAATDGQLQARSPEPQASSSSSIHVVTKGETLYRIAKNNGTDVATLKAINNKSNNTIYPGEKLQLPGAASGQPASYNSTTKRSPNPDGTYTVQKGDHLNAIADRFGTTAQAIMAANQLTGTTIYRGQVLDIPAMQSRSTGLQARGLPTGYNQDTAPRPSNATGEQLHRVRPGETVASIALDYGYTEQKLRDMNNMGPNQVAKIGQLLKVSDCDCPEEQGQLQARSPVPAAQRQSRSTPQSYSNTPAYRRDMVEPQQPARSEGELGEGDDFGQDATPEDRYYNTPNFTGRRRTNDTQTYGSSRQTRPRSPGRTYPAAQDELTPRRPYQPQGYNSSYSGRINEQQPSRNRSVYIVKDGDTLFNIARKYGTTVQRLRDINNLARGEVLIPYQKIYLN